jgi:hypothetical protein
MAPTPQLLATTILGTLQLAVGITQVLITLWVEWDLRVLSRKLQA